MCGIVVSISISEDAPILQGLCTANAIRGPDTQASVTRIISTGSGKTFAVSFTASVLHLRGDRLVSQPHENIAGDVLCWNGEIFQGLDVSYDENDGLKLFQALTHTDADAPYRVLSLVEGPYAFTFYRASDQSLFFGRDPLGRRSLLLRQSTTSHWSLELASVSCGPLNNPGGEFREISPRAIYHLHLDRLDGSRMALNSVMEHVNEDLDNSIPRQVLNAPKMFQIHERSNRDAFSAQHTLNRDLMDIQNDDVARNDCLEPIVDDFTKRLEESVGRRTLNIPPQGATARLAILFSGGIDCAIIAYLAHRFMPIDEPIDLLNVAFENPRSLKAKQKNSQGAIDVYDVPDRQTGLEQLDELRSKCPRRNWNFVKVNVGFDESSAARQTISNLMYPSRTVMDLSLAMALYFASAGVGTLHDGHGASSPRYVSPARVLLSGLGSDELLGGYSRHRVAFRTNSWDGLNDELQVDLDRLPSRNLGRDDRVISANAKEARYPYLDLSLVGYLASLPAHVKVDPRLEEGLGDKRLLRLAAMRWGLIKAAGRRKRAMQFGSRSAKMTGGADERKGDLLVA